MKREETEDATQFNFDNNGRECVEESSSICLPSKYPMIVILGKAIKCNI